MDLDSPESGREAYRSASSSGLELGALDTVEICGTEVGFWNPERPGLDGKSRRIRNFGDLLGPIVVQLMLASRGVAAREAARADIRLITVGSIMHYAKDGDVVWGTGVNGKCLRDTPNSLNLDVRAVRGPWSAAELSYRGYSPPRIYGDPALLLGQLIPDVPRFDRFEGLRLVVPNLNDLEEYRPLAPKLAKEGFTLLDPSLPLLMVASAIAHADFVTGTSLHATVLADAYGVPARLIRSAREPEFKYVDYLLGTGRAREVIASDFREAVRLGGHSKAEFDRAGLVEAFPWDLWPASGYGCETRQENGSAMNPSFAVETLDLWRERALGLKPVGDCADQLMIELERALGSRDGTEERVRMLRELRSLLVPDVPAESFSPEFRKVVAAIDRGDDATVLKALKYGGITESVLVRSVRDLGLVTLLSLDIDLGRAIGPSTSLEIVSGEPGSAKSARLPIRLFGVNHGQTLLEVDIMIPTSLVHSEALWLVNTDAYDESSCPIDLTRDMRRVVHEGVV